MKCRVLMHSVQSHTVYKSTRLGSNRTPVNVIEKEKKTNNIMVYLISLLTTSADPDEMPSSVALHPGPHCL